MCLCYPNLPMNALKRFSQFGLAVCPAIGIINTNIKIYKNKHIWAKKIKKIDWYVFGCSIHKMRMCVNLPTVHCSPRWTLTNRGFVIIQQNFTRNIEMLNWVFATNSDFLIPISLQPNIVDLRYFKLWIMLDRRKGSVCIA